jgi:LysR family glycine cleavage system transcriptional activator
MEISRLPLNALRAFDAAARHMSFKQAAEELHVTPAALSYQIRSLEELLQVQLFERSNRKVTLSPAGSRLCPGAREAFERLSAAVERAAPGHDDHVLVISAGPAFSAKWLAPRLSRFLELHPDIDPRISANLVKSDFANEQIDVAVRFGGGDYPDLKSIELLTDTATPMCSPDLVSANNRIERPEDLRNFTLIHDDSLKRLPNAPGWQTWLERAGASGVDAERGLRFNHADHALDAAIEGAGIVLGRTVLAARDLRLRRLVKPFGLELPVGYAFHLVAPPDKWGRANVTAFRNWMLDEIAADIM